jgi:hypothetical protein
VTSRHEQLLHGSVQIHAVDAVIPSGRPNQCWHLIGYCTPGHVVILRK